MSLETGATVGGSVAHDPGKVPSFVGWLAGHGLLRPEAKWEASREGMGLVFRRRSCTQNWPKDRLFGPLTVRMKPGVLEAHR